MVGMNSGYIASLPAPVKRRLKALKKIQLSRPSFLPFPLFAPFSPISRAHADISSRPITTA